jgi:RimJ/RimL family protein N-acetyltransferase
VNPYWPLFDLRVRTARLELRVSTDEDLFELTALAVARGIHPPELMPFTSPFTEKKSPELERHFLQRQWRSRAELGPDKWLLELAVRESGSLVGVQAIGAKEFRVLRTVHTGSWLGKDFQRKGIGTEMRAAVLHLAFAGLGAEVATSAAFVDNPASGRISDRLGYVFDGFDRYAPRGVAVDARRYRLTREAWEASNRIPVELEGLDPCRVLLGA